MGDSTVYRHLDTAALLVGKDGPVAARCAQAFERIQIRVVRVGHVAAACERLPIAMPQIVVVMEPVDDAERERLADTATAVGALVLHLDPELDADTQETLLERAACAAVERGLVRDEPVTRQAPEG